MNIQEMVAEDFIAKYSHLVGYKSQNRSCFYKILDETIGRIAITILGLILTIGCTIHTTVKTFDRLVVFFITCDLSELIKAKEYLIFNVQVIGYLLLITLGGIIAPQALFAYLENNIQSKKSERLSDEEIKRLGKLRQYKSKFNCLQKIVMFPVRSFEKITSIFQSIITTLLSFFNSKLEWKDVKNHFMDSIKASVKIPIMIVISAFNNKKREEFLNIQ